MAPESRPGHEKRQAGAEPALRDCAHARRLLPPVASRRPVMLTAANNEAITRTGPGTPMGEYLRRYWVPALTSSEITGARRPAFARALAGRGPHRLSHHLGANRPRPERLPAPGRLAVLRSQRGGRPALRLPWLEVRHRRALRRHALRAGREQLQEQGHRPRLHDGRAGRLRLGVHGPAGAYAGDAALRLDARVRRPRHDQPAHPGVQLPPGHRRRHRFRARALPARPAPKPTTGASRPSCFRSSP